jgi:hypothetical protein
MDSDIRGMERLIVKLDERPWHAVYRVALGSAIIPAWRLLFGAEPSRETLVVFFLGVLIALRVLPVVIRKALPFSASAREVWAKRREIGKKYDSYQWQKLFWIGLGLGVYVLLTREDRRAVLFLTMGCLIGGVAGVAAWNRRSGTLK